MCLCVLAGTVRNLVLRKQAHLAYRDVPFLACVRIVAPVLVLVSVVSIACRQLLMFLFSGFSGFSMEKGGCREARQGPGVVLP